MENLNWRKRAWIFLLIVPLFTLCNKSDNGNNPAPEPPPVGFKNPVINGSDPWVSQKDDQYYYTHTLGNRIAVWKTKRMSSLASAPYTTVYSPVAGTPNSANIWAPELHFIDGKWYMYYAAGSGPDNTQRSWVMENTNSDPTAGNWTDKGRIYASGADFWSIDGTVLQYNGTNYFVWSGRPDASVQNQNLYIAKMINPWTLESTATLLSKPELSWEKNGGPVNEGPVVLKNKNGNVFMIYSASGCWTDDYALGMLTLKANGDPLKVEDWTKSTQPVFQKKPEYSVYGPGHNSFFKSPDGKEDWIIYHANTNSGEGCSDKRNIRMQPFTWSNDNTPQFGEPVKINTTIPLPSGD